ncbi:transposable element Tc3 transposase [Trichonephila clavipes]|nr:transposable element Tc3 transposase [Trichonephila clavipes]
MQEDPDPVDDETNEEENKDNESSKGTSNADAFSALKTAIEWYEQQSERCSTQLILLKIIRDLAAKKRRYGDRFNNCQVIYSQFGLAIHQNDHQARRRFVEWAQNEIAVVPDFHKRILFSDEAPFWLNGSVNKQNCRIWSEANPQVYVETPLHPEKLTVWCALWAGGIIGPYFFKNDEGHNVTVNGDRYRAMITNFFIPEWNHHDVQELWFQQDGATCHTARATIDLLKDTFGDRLISRFGPVNWPPRSCDLTPLDYFLWGYVKSLVYADKPQTLDHLEDNIRRVIADIRPQMLEKVIENWTSRLDYIRASRGSPMPEITFKITLPSGAKVPICKENLLLKDCVLKNADFVEGIVVYAETILPAAESSDFARHLVLVLPHHTFNHVQTSGTLATDD